MERVQRADALTDGHAAVTPPPQPLTPPTAASTLLHVTDAPPTTSSPLRIGLLTAARAQHPVLEVSLLCDPPLADHPQPAVQHFAARYAPSFFLDVLDQGRALDVRHFLLGGSEEMLDALTLELQQRFPGVIVAGAESPPFRPLTAEELRAQDARITATRADVVWVGLGSPKQEFEAHRLATEMNVVVGAVGAAFDFTAGRVAPAPEWMQRGGLEWLHRLGSEPGRLWRRYLIGNTRFVWIASRSPR